MSSYILTQLPTQILAISEPMTIAVFWIVAILVITLAGILKYPQVGPVLQLWAGMGTITGAMVTYFFTREQVQRQEAQIKTYQTALQASANEKAQVGEQFFRIAAKIKPGIESAQDRQAFEGIDLHWGTGHGHASRFPVLGRDLKPLHLHPSPRPCLNRFMISSKETVRRHRDLLRSGRCKVAKWQRIGDEIKAAFIFARANLVNVHREA